MKKAKASNASYDIFISYRRDNGWDTAKHLRDILTAKGYSVFFDVDSLRSGNFNTALLDVIKNCTDFIIILSPNSLDRCVNEGDWVRRELACALQAGKNVIPVTSAKFHFPEKLPEDINDVRWKNAVAVNIDYFDAMVDKLISFLDSKPHKKPLPGWLIPVAAVCILAVAAAFFFLNRGSPAVPESSPPAAVQTETAGDSSGDTASGSISAGTSSSGTAEQTTAPTAAPEKKEPIAVETSWHGPNILMPQVISTNDSFHADALPAFGGEVTRGEIGSVTFLDTLEGKAGNAWDVSQDGDGSVMAWTVPDGELHNLYIAAEGGVYAPEDCSYLFCGYIHAESFSFGDAFHTDHVTSMSRMFFNDVAVRILDLSSFHTENVTQMIMMFDGCISLRALDVSGFDTSNVTNMLSMFDDCRELQKLDLSSFDTSKVRYTAFMFHNCRTLKELDISMFDTSQNEDIQSMFQQCVHMKSLHLGRFDTSMYPSSSDLFTDCGELTDVYYDGTEADWDSSGLGETLPAGVQLHFGQAESTPAGNTQNESDASEYENNVLMSDIFPYNEWYNSADWTVFGSTITRKEIGSVTFLDTLDGAGNDAWDVSQYGDGSVKAWTVKNGDLYDLYIAGKGGVSAPADCSVLFCGYKNMKSVSFGNAFHTEKSIDMRYMFSICENLRGLNLSCFRTENVTDMNSMFQYCSNMQMLDISSFSTSAVKNMGRMFMECRALAALDLSGFDTARVTDMGNMFFRCSSLRELDLSGFIMDRVTDISDMFFKCAEITDLKLSRFDAATIQELKTGSPFEGCTELRDVYYAGTETEWNSSGLGESLPEGVAVHFAQAETTQAESTEMKHIWGDYVPEGTATISTKDGNEYIAIANSLVRKAGGIEPSRSGAYLYSGLDNRSDETDYTAKDMVYFKDIASVERTGDVFQVTDRSGNVKEISLLSDARLLFIGTEDNGTALEVKEADIVSIRFDWSTVPETDVKYCKISQTDGTFTAPTSLFWFMVNRNEGTGGPPSMTLSRELSPYTDSTISVPDLQRIVITKNPTDAEFASSSEEYQTKMLVTLKSGEQKEITTSKFFVLFAQAKDGLLHTLDKSRLSEIVFY